MSEAQQKLSKQQLLDKIKQRHDELVEAIINLDEERMTSTGPHPDSQWTMKDVLDHLTMWMRLMISRLPGHEPTPYPVAAEAGESVESHMERINQYYYQQNKNKSMRTVGTEFDQAYRQVLQEIEKLTDDQLADPKLQQLIAEDSYDHYSEHLGFAADWLKEVAAEDAEYPLVSKAELLAKMQHGQGQLLATLKGLSDSQMTSPGPYPDSNWTVKDTLAHLAEWMRATPPRLPGGDGNAFPLVEQPTEDHDNFTERVNDYWYEQDKDKPLAIVRDEFDAAYRQLADAVEKLSDEQLARRETQWRIAGNSYGHFEEHLEYIKDWLAAQQPKPLMSKTELLALMQHSYERLHDTLSGLSEAQMTSPGPYPNSDWTIKDNLMHLAHWMRLTPGRLLGGSGASYPIEKRDDEDDDQFTERVNNYWREQDSNVPLDKAWAEFEDSYNKLLHLTENLSAEAAADRKTVYQIAGDTAWHFDEHLDYLGDWLKQQKQGQLPKSTSSQRQ